MSDDPEILPPGSRALPVVRSDRHSLSEPVSFGARTPRGGVASLITGLQARMETRSTRDIAENLRARADAANASTELGTAIMAFRQKAHELGEIDHILTQDRLRREHQRREE